MVVRDKEEEEKEIKVGFCRCLRCSKTIFVLICIFYLDASFAVQLEIPLSRTQIMSPNFLFPPPQGVLTLDRCNQDTDLNNNG